MLRKKWRVQTRKADFVEVIEENLLAESEVKSDAESTYS
jgi:hypothetical protein